MILPKGTDIETLSQLQKMVMKYWGGSFDDYQTIFSQKPNVLNYIGINRRRDDFNKALGIILYDDVKNLATEKILKTGWARGKKWWASIEYNTEEGQQFLIIYEGGLEGIATPARIPKILAFLEEEAKKRREKPVIGNDRNKSDDLYLNPIFAGMSFTAFKGHTILTTAIKEESAENWLNRHNSGLDMENNPMIENRLKGSFVEVVYNGKTHEIELENQAYPNDSIELIKLTETILSNTAFSVLWALGILQAMAGKRIFDAKIVDICKMISNKKKPAGREKLEVIRAIFAYSKIDIMLDEPIGKTGERRRRRYTPISIPEEFYTPGKLPHTLRLELFHQLQGDDFKPMALPENILSLPKTNYPLAFLLVYNAYHYKKSKVMKIEEPIIMEAAGLGKTYKANKTEARKRLKAKLLETEKAGIHGPFECIEKGYVHIRQINADRAHEIKGNT
jgi:hypothetical protein